MRPLVWRSARAKPGEVAVSILAEIIAAASEMPEREPTAEPAAETAIDPVCGIEVDVAGAKHTLQLEGKAYYFCCVRCRADFAADPQQYLAVSPLA